MLSHVRDFILTNITRTKEELESLLVDQLRLLRKSCGNDERWDFTEGHNVVTRVRVLLHQTSKSHSLLEQLNIRDGMYLNSIGAGNTLVLPAIYGPWPRFLIPYRPWSLSNCSPFKEWWESSLIIVANVRTSRKELVTMLANQEGGAQVDPEMKAGLANLRRSGSGWSYIHDDDSHSPMNGFEIGTARAIGFEVLWSLEKYHGEYLGDIRERFGDVVDDATYMRDSPPIIARDSD